MSLMFIKEKKLKIVWVQGQKSQNRNKNAGNSTNKTSRYYY